TIDGGTWIAKDLRLARRVRPNRYGDVLRAARLPARPALRRRGRLDGIRWWSASCRGARRTYRTGIDRVSHDRRRRECALGAWSVRRDQRDRGSAALW